MVTCDPDALAHNLTSSTQLAREQHSDKQLRYKPTSLTRRLGLEPQVGQKQPGESGLEPFTQLALTAQTLHITTIQGNGVDATITTHRRTTWG